VIRYRESPPPPDLAPFLRCLWTLEGPAPAAGEPSEAEPLLPDGCTELVVHFGDRFRRERGGRRELQGRAFLVGQIRSPFTVVPTGSVGVVGARFRLGGAAPWLRRIPAGTLVETELDLDHLDPAGATTLAERVACAPGATERIQLVCHWLRAHLQPGTRSPAVAAAASWLERTRGRTRVDELAARMHLGARQLERLFAAEIGLGPKLCARILRFQSVLAGLRERPGGLLVHHAARAGYSDEAHLVREFREFSGTSPRAWLARHTPIAARMAGFDS